MSLASVGRNAVLADRVALVDDVGAKTAKEVKGEANDKLSDARKGLLNSLTPWIPGDFVVAYGTLLTAWEGLRASFVWLLIISAASAITFIVLGAFAATGFKGPKSATRKINRRLAVRTVIGFFVSIYAAFAIPRSGWYDFDWFSKNESAVVITAGVAVIIVVSVLKGLQKRGVIEGGEE
jgi:hypothetical protein